MLLSVFLCCHLSGLRLYKPCGLLWGHSCSLWCYTVSIWFDCYSYVECCVNKLLLFLLLLLLHLNALSHRSTRSYQIRLANTSRRWEGLQGSTPGPWGRVGLQRDHRHGIAQLLAKMCALTSEILDIVRVSQNSEPTPNIDSEIAYFHRATTVRQV